MGLFDKILPKNPLAGSPTPETADKTQLYPNVLGRKLYTIKAERWDLNLPYYFTVRVASKDGRVDLQASAKVEGFKDFRLPINPSNISISAPFSINVIPTTRGILEEHNGLVFRNIMISGTTGMAPGNLRSGGYDSAQPAGGFSNAAVRGAIAIGANTLGNFNDAVKNFQRTITAATGGLPALKSGIDSNTPELLGHAKLHALFNYFVSYAESKKDPKNANARLLFVSQKDNTGYICTPISFEFTKSNDNPHIFFYKIALKAWDLADTGIFAKENNPFGFEALTTNQNLLTRYFNTLKEARATLSSAQNAIRAVASDFENAYKVVAETMLVVKELGNFGRTLADFPNLISSRWNVIARDFDQKSSEIKATFSGAPSSQVQKNSLQSAAAISQSAKATNNSLDPTNPAGTPVRGQSDFSRNTAQQKIDTQNPFGSTSNTITHVDLLDSYSLDSVVLNDSESQNVNDQINTLQSLTLSDYDIRRRKLEEVRDAYADSRQLNDSDYDIAAGRTTAQGLKQAASNQDMLVIKSFNDVILVIDALSATNELIRKKVPDPFIRAQEAVDGSGIIINNSNTVFPAPFPFKGTLEQLAAVYLGDPDRWIEIALINNLKPPYIDEDGFIRNFTTSGSGNSFTVSDATNMFLGQEIFIYSAVRKEERRIIVDIKKLGVSNFLIVVDGDSDLNQFTTTHLAKMKAFLPNTVNSSKVIFIPIPGAVPENENIPDTREIPITKNLNAQQRLMGVDIALTEGFDIAVTNTGDAALSVGLANAIQAIKLKLAIEHGQLKQHPEYGSGLPVGERNEFTAEDIKQFIESAILKDERFQEITNIEVQLDGPTVRVNITVRLVSNGGTIPISFIL